MANNEKKYNAMTYKELDKLRKLVRKYKETHNYMYPKELAFFELQIMTDLLDF